MHNGQFASHEAHNPWLLAFYLPQYHPISENDRWWGRGFTEWTNVTKARPLFKDHYQPHLPADLGFYDLRLPEARAAQAELARTYGIHGFCYYHYWFNGRRVLERPVNEILWSGEPDFPFCLCWANENWTRRWDGQDKDVLLEQSYSPDDDIAHIRSLIPAFQDPRYIRVDGKPLFLVYRSTSMPDSRATTDRWRREAERAGLEGLYLVRIESFAEKVEPLSAGFDAALEFQPHACWSYVPRIERFQWWQRRKLRTRPTVFDHHNIFSYEEIVKAGCEQAPSPYPLIRSVCPSWDNSARRPKGAWILHGSTPDIFGRWVSSVAAQIARTKDYPGHESPLLFVNAWNEWAEGNHLEPCHRWGRGYLEALSHALSPYLVQGTKFEVS